VSGDAPTRSSARVAALTHGHPSGYLAAGALAVVIAEACRGRALPDAVAAARACLVDEPDGGEVLMALDRAVSAAAPGRADADVLSGLGAGWVAEEALAMSVFCALVAEDFRSGVLLAVHHDGDSDSTGAITGNLLGASLGVAAIPADLLDGLEGRDVIRQIAEDLHAVYVTGTTPDAGRYPPW
jgi:ADP-ribosyl-[dinitrogen reductase] hydrolase